LNNGLDFLISTDDPEQMAVVELLDDLRIEFLTTIWYPSKATA